MRHILNFITYSLIVIITGILIRIIFSENIFQWLQDPSSWIIILILALIGILIETAVIHLFCKKDIIGLYPKYFFGGCFLLFLIYYRYDAFRYKQSFGNIEHNNEYFEYFIDDYKAEKKIAFDELMLMYPNKNDIRITAISIDVRDTLFEGHTRFICFVKFNYRKKKEDLQYTAKISVLNELAQIIEYDRPMNEFERYYIDSLHSEALQNLKEAIDVMPDSMATKIKKEFKEVIQ